MKPEPVPAAAAPRRMTMVEAVVQARAALGTVTTLTVDAIGRCERQGHGGWLVHVDVVESMARMGDNDLLATFEIEMDGEGEPLRIERLGRYRREDREAP